MEKINLKLEQNHSKLENILKWKNPFKNGKNTFSNGPGMTFEDDVEKPLEMD